MLSVIIPARNEQYLGKTIENVLANAEGEIEVLAVLDGYIPDPQLKFDERVKFIHFKEPVGQRKAINEAVKMAKGKYIMKLDAHCAVSKGFDVILARDCEPSWTMVPTMYCLDADTWKPKLNKRTDYMYITSPSTNEEGNANSHKPFRAAYYRNQPKNDLMIDDTMACMGPGWFMHKDRFWEQGGCDENHEGGWGAQSIEVSLKAWLSGGALKVNKNCWFAHWFRKEFPWPASGRLQEKVREYSRDLWVNDKWPLATRKLQWLVEKFDPPGWDKGLTIIYYTANVIHPGIEYSVLRSLRKYGYPIVSVSQKPMDLGKNIVVPKERSRENIYRQVLIGVKEATTEYVALCEDDCLYVPEHFKYRPTKPFGYNLNRWLLHLDGDTHVFSYRKRPILSQCIAHRETLIKCLESSPSRDFEMGRNNDGFEFETFETKEPNLVFCHKGNTTGRKLIGEDAEPRTELQPWGTVTYWMEKFERRRNMRTDKYPMISLCLPTRERPGLFKRMCLSALNTADNPNNIEFVIYRDDDDTTPYEYFGNYKLIVGKDRNKKFTTDMHNECWRAATGPIYMITIDDHVFETKGWDTQVLTEFDKSKDKLIYVAPISSDWERWNYSSTGFLHKNWTDAIGYFLPSANAGSADKWLYEVSKNIGRLVNISAKITHTNEHDELHRRKNKRQHSSRYYALPESVEARERYTETLKKLIGLHS